MNYKYNPLFLIHSYQPSLNWVNMRLLKMKNAPESEIYLLYFKSI